MIAALSSVQKIVGVVILALFLGLILMLAITRAEVRHLTKALDAQTAAIVQTVTNVRLAAAEATRQDAANKARVEAEQRAISERTVNDYEARIAAVRERYAGLLRSTPQTHPGSAASAPVPGPGPATGRADGATADQGFPLAAREIATEQALQLEALQAWVRGQARVGP